MSPSLGICVTMFIERGESCMKREYEIDNLISGNLYSVSSGKTMGPTICETDERFIFEKVTLPIIKKVSYREIFTGAKMKLNSDNYDKTSCFADPDTWYITDPADLTCYLTKEELDSGFISNFRLLDIYNEMNFVIVGSKLNDHIKRLK